jgi:type I restriction-modification system DNA methylase subunit
MSSAIKLTPKQVFSANEWVKLLESGVLEDEKKNYFRFASLVLEGVLGYSISEELDFETGNVEFSFRDSSGKGGVCIEVKGTKTKDLFADQHREKPEHQTPIKQTWDYIGRGSFEYGIATNYRDFVLIDRSKGYSRYYLFDFLEIRGNEQRLKAFVAVFSRDAIIVEKLIPQLYYQSSIEERIFTAEFYKLYHETRLMILREFETGGKANREQALHSAQVLLNRLIFMFFAQGTGKLRRRLFAESVLESLNPNLVSEYSHYAYDTIVNLFERLDKGSKSPVEVFGFNGGLFKERLASDLFFLDIRREVFFKDIVLHSNLKGTVELDEPSKTVVSRFRSNLNPIIRNLLILSSFDFQSEVDVNILGHIFEQSIMDLEELQGIGGPSKRKKEAIYYTPTFVTEYICRNTIVPLLSKSGKSDVEGLLEEYSSNMDELEKRFKSLRILDMACGSGAFLLAAVDLLLDIHKRIRIAKEARGSYTTKLKGVGDGEDSDFWKITRWNDEEEARQIIEQNIFGVDKNEESVEITKLSLFLKMASTNRKLIDLSSNIKRGNSVISDNAVADGVGLDWQREFKETKQGFDLVIGNPPYIPLENMTDAEAEYYANHYDGIFRKYDTSVIFVERGLDLLRPEGMLGFIMPLTWQTGDNYLTFRKMLFVDDGVSLTNLVNLPFDVFPDAYVDTGIAIFKKSPKVPGFAAFQYGKNDRISSIEPSQFDVVGRDLILSEPDLKVFPNRATYEILQKVRKGGVMLGAITGSAQGIVTSKFPVEKTKKSDHYSPFLIEADGNRYRFIVESSAFIDFRKAASIHHLYSQDKLMVRRIVSRQNRLMALYDSSGIITNKDYNPFVVLDEFKDRYDMFYLLALLNSKLFSFLYTSKSSLALKDDFRQTTLAEVRSLPVKEISKPEQQGLASGARRLTELHAEYFGLKRKLLRRISENFKVRISQKLEQLVDLSFSEFKSEIERSAKRRLKLDEQDEWETYFNHNVKVLKVLRDEITAVEGDVDNMVCELYEINESERALIEASVLDSPL